MSDAPAHSAETENGGANLGHGGGYLLGRPGSADAGPGAYQWLAVLRA